MARHKLKKDPLKAFSKGQVPGKLYVQRAAYRGITPVSHHAEDRAGGFCGPCGHSLEWHDNVVLKVAADGTTHSPVIRCRGAFLTGLTVIDCKCRYRQ